MTCADAFEDAIDIAGGETKLLDTIRTVGGQAAGSEWPKREHQLKGKLAELERTEEALIELALVADFDARRPNADPLAVLGIQFGLISPGQGFVAEAKGHGDAFVESWGVKYDKAVECLTKDRDALHKAGVYQGLASIRIESQTSALGIMLLAASIHQRAGVDG